VCRSHIGRKGGQQKILLDTDCRRANVIHEIIHALGFGHEHSRKDRDKYVTIQWDNIEKKNQIQFNKTESFPLPWESITFGVDYDAKSIMHYKKTDFAWNDKNTIVPTVRISAIFKQGL
jgi:hypothetical protein